MVTSTRRIIIIALVATIFLVYCIYFANQALTGDGWERALATIVGDYSKYYSPDVSYYSLAGYFVSIIFLKLSKVSVRRQEDIMKAIGVLLLILFFVVQGLTLIHSHNIHDEHAIEKGTNVFLIPLGIMAISCLPLAWAKWDKFVDAMLDRFNRK